MKICCLAIVKNEEHRVEGLIKSCIENKVDLYVYDTGSTDATMSLLDEYNIPWQSITIEPFSFAEARNKALELAPNGYDIYIPVDADMKILPTIKKLKDVELGDKEIIWFYQIYPNGETSLWCGGYKIHQTHVCSV